MLECFAQAFHQTLRKGTRRKHRYCNTDMFFLPAVKPLVVTTHIFCQCYPSETVEEGNLLIQKERLSRSFLDKWHILHENKQLARFLPDTSVYSSSTLQQFFRDYGAVMIRPDIGLSQEGIYLTAKTSSKKARPSLISGFYKKKAYHFLGLNSLEFWLDFHQNNQLFLIQQFIPLLACQGIPYKLCTLVQKNEQQSWEVTGMFAKREHSMSLSHSALPSVKIERNATDIMPITVFMQKAGIEVEEQIITLLAISDLSLLVAQHLEKSYGNRMYGIETGIDKSGKMWLLAVLTKPNIRLLEKVDKKMFQRVQKLQTHNRFSDKGRKRKSR